MAFMVGSDALLYDLGPDGAVVTPEQLRPDVTDNEYAGRTALRGTIYRLGKLSTTLA